MSREIGERMLRYRARHKLTQVQLAKIIGENSNTIFRCENKKNKLHKVNEIRLDLKMKELEEKEDV
jgi:DNA-binding XRE family transcriptional regulator